MLKKAYFIALVLTFIATGCSAKKFDGKTSDDVFPDLRAKALADAACSGKVDKIKTLVAKHSNVNTQGFENVTPLIWAVLCENSDGVKALLEAGADPNQKAFSDVSPIILAVNIENSTVLQVLLQAGANPDTERKESERSFSTALELAFERGVYTDDWTHYELLLSMGADINKPASDRGGIAEHALTWARFCKISDLLDLGYDYELERLFEMSDRRRVSENGPGYVCQSEVLEQLKERMSP